MDSTSIILVLILFLNRRVMYELVLDFIIILHNALRTLVEYALYIYIIITNASASTTSAYSNNYAKPLGT